MTHWQSTTVSWHQSWSCAKQHKLLWLGYLCFKWQTFYYEFIKSHLRF